MIRVDEDALSCDLAETYHIYDYKRLSPLRVASFSLGLKDESRIKLKLSGQNAPTNTLLLALLLDELRGYLYGKKKPPSMFEAFQKVEKKTGGDFNVYKNAESFIKARNNIIKGD